MRPPQSGCAYFKWVTPRESLYSDGRHRSLYSRSRFSCSVIRDSSAWLDPRHRSSKLSRMTFRATTAGSPAGAGPIMSWATADHDKTKSAIKQATNKLLRGIRDACCGAKQVHPVKVAARAMMNWSMSHPIPPSCAPYDRFNDMPWLSFQLVIFRRAPRQSPGVSPKSLKAPLHSVSETG